MIIKRDGSLTTGATLNPNNVWSGSAFEYLRAPSYVNIGIISPTTAALSGLLSACYIGAALLAEEFVVPNVDPAIYGLNTPQIANNFYIQGGGNAGDRLVNTLRNPTAGTVAYDAIAQIVPAGGRRGGR
jgi:hypothetical protein